MKKSHAENVLRLTSILLIGLVVISCSPPFKGGKFYDRDDQDPYMVIRYIFHENGQFETVIVRPGRIDVSKKGAWKARKNTISVTVDTIYEFDRPPEKVSNVIKFHRVPSDSSKLFRDVRAGNLRGKMTLRRY